MVKVLIVAKQHLVLVVTQKTEQTVNKKKSIEFAEKFVNNDWIEILERNYANGNGIHASIAKDVMIISLISLPATQISKLAKTIGIHDPFTLRISPLFSSLIISKELDEFISGLHDKVRNLIPSEGAMTGENSDSVDVSQEDVDNLTSIFPDLGDERAKAILRQHDNNVELVINKLLENPSLIDQLSAPKIVTKSDTNKKEPVKVATKVGNRFKDDNFETFKSKSNKNIKINNIDEKLKETTLKMALSSLEDGDEPELELYSQFEEYFEQKKQSNNRGLKNTEGRQSHTDDTKPTKPDNNDYLYSVYQSEGIKPFTPEYRGKTLRAHIKEHTGWSDNLIEDWGRIMELSNSKHGEMTSPKTTNNNKNQKTDKSKSKRDQKYNESHKASKANHNRKSAHGKKSKIELG